MHEYIYILYIYTFLHTHTHTRARAYIYRCMTRSLITEGMLIIYIYAYIHFIHAYIHTDIWVCMNLYANILYTYIHSSTRVCLYAYEWREFEINTTTYVRACVCSADYRLVTEYHEWRMKGTAANFEGKRRWQRGEPPLNCPFFR